MYFNLQSLNHNQQLMFLTSSINPGNGPQQGPIGLHNNSSDVLPRIPSLDVLRGIAVLGAMFISIWMFGGYSNNEQNGLLIQAKGFNYRMYSTVNLLLHGKMPALIAIVFGASMISYLFKRTQLVNAEFFIRRQMWLIALGLINAFVFLWSGDLLFHFGIMGILLFPFVRLSARGLLVAATLTTLIYCAKIYWSYSDDRGTYNKYLAVVAAEKKITTDSLTKTQKLIATRISGRDSLRKVQKDTLSKRQKEEKQAWEGLLAGMKYDPKKDDGKNKAMRESSYGKIWEHQMQDTQSREAQWTYRTGIWELGSMIFLGMALFRFSFFDAGFSARKYLLIALVSLSIGLLLGWFRLHYNHVALIDYVKYIKRYPIPFNIFYPLEIALTTLAYTSLVLWLLSVGFVTPVWKGFATAGKMALTNYLTQSIICTVFFTGFGMGYFARLQQWQLYVFAAEVVLVNIVFSVLWLRSFNYGPAEWLWRCLIYKKWLPNRKADYNVDAVTAIS